MSHEKPLPQSTNEKIRIEDNGSTTFIHAEGKEKTSPCPVIFAPGLGESAEWSFRKPTEELAALGHDVYAISHPSKGLSEEFLRDELNGMVLALKVRARARGIADSEIDALIAKIPITEFRKAYVLVTFAREKVLRGNGGRVDIIGHSQGGSYALIAAFLEPTLVDHLVLVNPAGQVGGDSFARMFRSFHWRGLTEAIQTGKWTAVWDTVAYLLARSYMLLPYSKYSRAMQEGRALADFDAYPFLMMLQRLDPAIDRVTMYDTSDRLMRKKKIEDAARIARGKQDEQTALGERRVTKGMGHYSLITHAKEFAMEFHRILTRKPAATA